jgi:hypothetical protein
MEYVLDYFSRLNKTFEKKSLKAGGKTKTNTTRRKVVRDRVNQSISRLQSIGFRKPVLETRLKYLTDKHIDDFSINDVIIGLTNSWLKHNGDINETLENLGLNKSVKEELGAVLKPLQDTYYSDYQLFNIGIDYLLDKYKPVRGPKAKFFYRPHNIDTWFNTQDGYNIINIPHQCDESLVEHVNDKINIHYSESDGSTLYYHATSWGYANSILEYTDFTKGSNCQDFGLTPGFYLSDDLEIALNWGVKKMKLFSKEIAIIVFRLPKNFERDFKYKYLQGFEWLDTVKKSRQCISEGTSELRQLIGYDFLYGNMVSNPSKVRDGKEEPRTHPVPRKQLVSRSRESDDFLNKHILGSIFFQKHIEK